MEKTKRILMMLFISVLIGMMIAIMPTTIKAAEDPAEEKIVITNTSITEQNDILFKGDIFSGTVMLEPLQTLTNVSVSIEIPQGVTIKQATYQDADGNETQNGVVINGNKIVVNIARLEAHSIQAILITLEIGNFQGTFSYMAQVTADNMPMQTSNTLQYTVAVPHLSITQTSNKTYVKEAEQIEYQFTIKNVGSTDVNRVIFEDSLPEGLSFVKMQYTYEGNTTEINSSFQNTAKITWTNFAKDATSQVTIIAQADLLENETRKEVKNSATLEANGLEKITSNTIANIIQYNQSLYGENQQNQGNTGNQTGSRLDNEPDNEFNNNQTANQTGSQSGSQSNNQSGNQTTKNNYKILGTVWADSNKNGQRDENENLLSGVEVILLNKNNLQIVKDKTTGENKIKTTDTDGTYEFTNLEAGNYLVVFVYNSGRYSITEYQKEQVSENNNSDAKSKLIMYNGIKTYAGITNTITVQRSDIKNIDLGLYVDKKFDLKLEQYISQITLTTPTIGTQTTHYQNKTLAKVEVLSQNVNKSDIVVEYKIIITNEGQVTGYAKKIVDYLPLGVEFNEELNPDWHLGEDEQTVYTQSLEDTKINPGESKELTLKLSMPISDETIGTILTNQVEIAESNNEQDLKDIDSEPGNRLAGEDDMATTEIVTTIVTGDSVLYITLTMAVLFTLATGVLTIKRKVLNKRG